MAKKGMKRTNVTHTKPRNQQASVPEIQGKAKQRPKISDLVILPVPINKQHLDDDQGALFLSVIASLSLSNSFIISVTACFCSSSRLLISTVNFSLTPSK